MSLVASSGAKHPNLLAYPFKAYVVVAFLAALAWTGLQGRRAGFTDFGIAVTFGYVVCFFVLLALAAVQRIAGRRKEAISSILFACLALVCLCLLVPAFFSRP